MVQTIRHRFIIAQPDLHGTIHGQDKHQELPRQLDTPRLRGQLYNLVPRPLTLSSGHCSPEWTYQNPEAYQEAKNWSIDRPVISG
ncbi:hypothetical protein PENSUB_13852 [Penicillium subrubescens]|jgi:hypothetical protein|uniref:Uncharacterized protein n=1 Tax=Penicillium subrubescens TaxID=1316194 RepID=A0A1Q5SMI0_9EURO|nr:hypothetical protein PENSUB_13852 [Penicillium subrubescens]